MVRHARSFISTLGALGLLLSTGAAAAEPTLQARVDQVIDQALADKRIVGMVVLVAQDGKVVYHRAAGKKDREANTPMREDTIFRLASVSKPLVSAALLALVDKGTLGLDEPITRWLPTFTPSVAGGAPAVITVRQLLTHTSGLSYTFAEPEGGPYHRAQVSSGLDQPGLSLEDNLRRLASVPLLFEPGSKWSYSMSIDVLGAVVAKASGMTLPKALEGFVTLPLHMSDTGFVVRDNARLAVPYADGKSAPIRMGNLQQVPYMGAVVTFATDRVFNTRSYPSGGAGMVGTAGDLLKFLEAVRQGEGSSILEPKTAAQMMVNQVGALESSPGQGFGWGGAVILDPVKAKTPQSVGTWQWSGAYGHSWFVDPQRRLTVVALTNTAMAGMAGAFPTALADAVYAGTSTTP